MSAKIRYFIAVLIITAGTIVTYKTQSIEYGYHICLMAYFIHLFSKELKINWNEPIKIDTKSIFSGETLLIIAYIFIAYLVMTYVENNKDSMVTTWYFLILFWLYWISGLIVMYRIEIEEKEKLINKEQEK